MKEIISTTWSLVKLLVAYSFALIGTAIGIPGQLLYQTGAILLNIGEKIARATEKSVDGKQIINEIIDM